MKVFPTLIIGTLLVITFATPVQEVAEFIKKLKSRQFYEDLMPTVGGEVKQAKFVLILRQFFDDDHDGIATAIQQIDVQPLIKATRVLLETLNATLPEGAKPTEEQITEFAKKFSRILRESDFKVHAVLSRQKLKKPLIVSKNTVSFLKSLVVNHSIEAVGGNNNLFEIMEREQPAVYRVTEIIQRWNSRQGELLKYPTLTFEKWEDFTLATKQFTIEYRGAEFLRQQRSEENAIEFFKDFGVFVSTLKDSASYDTFEALYRNLARSKRWESIALLIKNTAKCFAQPLSACEKQIGVETLQSLLKLFKPVSADGHKLDFEQLKNSLNNWENERFPVVLFILRRMGLRDNSYQINETVMKCLHSDEAIAIYKEIIAVGLPTVSEEKLEEIKRKNEIAYSIVALLNHQAKRIHRREGLSKPAIAFVKKLSGVPNSLISMIPLVPFSPEAREMMREAKLSLVREFKSLSVDVKMELVEEFPYQTIISLASLN